MKILSWHFKIKTDAHFPLKCSCLRKMAPWDYNLYRKYVTYLQFQTNVFSSQEFFKKSYSKILITLFHLLFNSSTYKHKNIDQTCYWSNADHWSSTWEHRNRAWLILLHPQTSFFPWPHLAVCRILVPQPGVKPMPPALGAQQLTTGSPGKFLHTAPAPRPNSSL